MEISVTGAPSPHSQVSRLAADSSRRRIIRAVLKIQETSPSGKCGSAAACTEPESKQKYTSLSTRGHSPITPAEFALKRADTERKHRLFFVSDREGDHDAQLQGVLSLEASRGFVITYSLWQTDASTFRPKSAWLWTLSEY